MVLVLLVGILQKRTTGSICLNVCSSLQKYNDNTPSTFCSEGLPVYRQTKAYNTAFAHIHPYVYAHTSNRCAIELSDQVTGIAGVTLRDAA